MKKSFYILLLSFISFNASAQQSLDSLWSVWNDENQADTARTYAQQTLSNEHYLYINNDSALISANLAIQFAEQKNLPKEKARGLLIRSKVMEQIGQPDNAINDVVKAEKLFRDVQDEESATKCLNTQGNYHTRQDDQKEAIKCYVQALTYYRKVENHKGEAGCLINTASLYPMEDIQRKNLASQGIAICREYGYDDFLAVGLGALSAYYFALYDFDEQTKQ